MLTPERPADGADWEPFGCSENVILEILSFWPMTTYLGKD